MVNERLMRVDTVPHKWLFVGAGIAVLIMFVASLSAGLAGPNSTESTTYYAYDCPNDSHDWSSQCSGVQVTLWFVVVSTNLF